MATQNESTTLIILGATGDLTRRKLVPALYHLHRQGLLPKNFTLVGFARRSHSDDDFRQEMLDAISEHSTTSPKGKAWEQFASMLRYQQGDFTEATGYKNLKKLLDEIEGSHDVPEGEGNRLYYLATPPSAYEEITTQLGSADLNGSVGRLHGWTRIIIEKPFGHDLASAKKLNTHILKIFREEQIYRIDHYLGKETVQNIMAFRFGNSIFEPLWNRNYIDHVQILVAEKIGIEGRGNYYDPSGALRDIVQNHILQILALVGMEPPATFTANAVRNEKLKVLQAIEPITPQETKKYTVRGQYTTYRNEEGVEPDSTTETYVAMRLMINNWRWAGVPFYLRTGKSLTRRLTEITIQFRQPPLTLFAHKEHEQHEGPQDIMEPNLLTIQIQPEEGITLRVGAKPPGGDFALQPVELHFDYAHTFKGEPPEAYERLLLDALIGDATLFIRRDEVEEAWALMDPILQEWSEGHVPNPLPYWSGTWGPDNANTLIEQDGRHWYVSRENEKRDNSTK
jgi:glucose-6-phosphate 1-dehydrogenase